MQTFFYKHKMSAKNYLSQIRILKIRLVYNWEKFQSTNKKSILYKDLFNDLTKAEQSLKTLSTSKKFVILKNGPRIQECIFFLDDYITSLPDYQVGMERRKDCRKQK
jgi:hypothetical protein